MLVSDEENSAKLLRQLVTKLRPSWFSKLKSSDKKVTELAALLAENSAYLDNIRQHVAAVLEGHSLALYAESGILANEGFVSELVRKFGHLLLPPAPDTTDIRDTFDFIFYRRHDYKWVAAVDDQTWAELLRVLYPPSLLEGERERTLNRYYDTLEILAHRATAIGLHPEIISRYPLLRRSDNPILEMNRAAIAMVEAMRQNTDYAMLLERLPAIRQRITECVRLVQDVRNGQHETGASLALTYMLQRLRQHLSRMRMFLDLLENHPDPENWRPQVQFFKQLVRHESFRYSIRELVLKNIGFLAFQITEHGGRTGEHYITHGRHDYRKMMWSAMGGGLIVGFLSIFKVFAYYAKWSPFGTAFLYSMNYSLGFIGIHVTHSTLATKQPAMTASRIAKALDEGNSDDDGMKSLSDLVVKTFRSQFIAFMGNMFIAFPVAFIASYVLYMMTGNHVAGEEKAWKMIAEIHPWESLSLFHAGIAGVCLFLTGIISGYYDNAVVYRNLPERIYHHPFLRRVTPKGLRRRFSNYIGNNLGSLTGNFFLGVMLGSIGTLGYIFGLPIDIRHITFASGNFGVAIAAIGPYIDFSTLMITLLGIVLIGFMNFIVSFSLAIFVATQSRRVAFSKSGVLFKSLLTHFITAPREFLFPPRETMEVVATGETSDTEHPAQESDEERDGGSSA